MILTPAKGVIHYTKFRMGHIRVFSSPRLWKVSKTPRNIGLTSEPHIFFLTKHQEFQKMFSTMRKKPDSTKTVASITKAAEILKKISDGVDRITDLSTKLQLSTSTVHRLLKSLETTALVSQDPVTRRYYLGPLILSLGSKPIIAHQHLIISAFDGMRHLRDLTCETVVLHVRIGLERICLEELQSFENIRYTVNKGNIAPLYVGSAGRILLSELQDNELESILRCLRLESVGPNTILDKKVLLKELEKVRKQGYATSFGERIPGGASIAVPIKKYICPVALTILGPDNRFTIEKMMEYLPVLKKSATSISNKLTNAPGQ